MSDPVICCAAGVVLRDTANCVLLLQRPDGSWGLPGGKQEAGETPQQAALRELEEETGHVLSPDALVPLAQVVNADGVQFTAYGARCQRFDVVMADGEHNAWAWAPLDALPQPLYMQSEAFIGLAIEAPAMAMDEARVDVNGWREYPDNPISVVGVFPYAGKQIDASLEPDKIYMVLRPESELADPACVESFKLVPWVAGHTMLGQQFTPAEQKGISGVVGEQVYFSEGVLYGNLKMFNDAHASLIDKGVKDLSLGYRCRYEYAPGVFNGQAYDYVQRDIRGNHLATVPEGRMGPMVAVQDHFSFDAKDDDMADENNTTPAGEGGGEMTVAEAVKQITELLPLLQKLAAVAGAAAAPAAATEPAATTEPAAEPAATEDGDAPTPEKVAEDAMPLVLRAIGRRDKLAAALTKVVGVFDHADMTEGDVAAYGCEKLGIKADKTNASAMLEGYLLAASKAPQPRAVAAMDGAASAQPDFMTKFLGESRI